MAKTCYRCGKVYNTKESYCEECVIIMAELEKNKHEKKAKRWNFFTLLFGWNL